jgi:ParB/RepB/Spo0J family partition protein
MFKDEIVEIALSEIDRPTVIARDEIDPEKIRELAESIRAIGLRQPVLVRPTDGRYEMVAGDRRYLAHKLIGAETIKAIVREMSDEECTLVRAVENLQREDLSPLEKARTYGYMRDRLGYGTEKIARRVGIKVVTVARYLNLLTLPEEFQQAVNKCVLSVEAAYVLKEVDDPQFRNYYLKAAVENGATVAVVRMWVEDYRRTKEGNFYAAQGEGPGGHGAPEALPIFRTCAACRGPVKAEEMRYVGLCLGCADKTEGR